MNTKTQTHTPTPWSYENIAGHHSVNLSDGSSFTVDNKADAAFTVRAVNVHEELLEACKFLVEQHRFLQSNTSMQLPARIYTAIEKAAQAIAKAEGVSDKSSTKGVKP